MKKNPCTPLLLLAALLTAGGPCRAQWTEQDSLRLRRQLESPGELRLNPDALRSMDFGAEPPRAHALELWFDETLPSPFPETAVDTFLRRPLFSLDPYQGIYLYKRNSGRQLFTPSRPLRPLPALRTSSASDTMSSRFKSDFANVFSSRFWGFRRRRHASQTLAALKKYDTPEQNNGRYEYYQVEDEYFDLTFEGNDSLRPALEQHLHSSRPFRKGLLYLRFTALGRGIFTYFLPDGTDVRGTFATNGTRYTLHHSGGETVFTLTHFGGKLFTIRRDLTSVYRALWHQGISKVEISASVWRIAAGRDRP